MKQKPEQNYSKKDILDEVVAYAFLQRDAIILKFVERTLISDIFVADFVKIYAQIHKLECPITIEDFDFDKENYYSYPQVQNTIKNADWPNILVEMKFDYLNHLKDNKNYLTVLKKELSKKYRLKYVELTLEMAEKYINGLFHFICKQQKISNNQMNIAKSAFLLENIKAIRKNNNLEKFKKDELIKDLFKAKKQKEKIGIEKK